MTRKTGQLIALFAVIVLVIIVLVFQFRQDLTLKTSVIHSLSSYGYPGSGSVTLPSSLSENIPYDVTNNEGLPRLHFVVPYNQPAILDGLQFPQYVPAFNSIVLWTPYPDQEQVVLDDSTASRTYFVSPSSDMELVFILKILRNGAYVPVAEYVFEVRDPIIVAADFDHDGLYTFSDLVNLLQNWNESGDDALNVLAWILSNYEIN